MFNISLSLTLSFPLSILLLTSTNVGSLFSDVSIAVAHHVTAVTAVIDAPLLFTAGLDQFCDLTVKVTAPEEERVRRIMNRDGIPQEAALRRVGLTDCFEAVLTSEDFGMDKRSAAIYQRAMEKMGYVPEQTLICEDALFAVRSAAGSGAKVLAFRDETNAGSWEEIRELADYAE